MRTTRRGVELASQALEIHGGNGYVEDWPTARQLRDAQCHTIWEGTENIICLDILRALRDEQVLDAVFAALQVRAGAGATAILGPVFDSVADGVREVREGLAFLSRAERDLAQLRARRFCNYFADVVQAALLLEEAEREMRESGNARKAVIARLFVDAHLRAPHARGLTSSSRTALDLFLPLTRYGVIDPAQAESALRHG